MSKKYGGSLLNSLSNINISSATQHFHHEVFFQGRVKILTLIDQTLTPYFTVTSIRIFLCNLLVVFSFCFTFWLGLFVPETKNLILCLFNLSLRVSKKKPFVLHVGVGPHIWTLDEELILIWEVDTANPRRWAFNACLPGRYSSPFQSEFSINLNEK